MIDAQMIAKIQIKARAAQEVAPEVWIKIVGVLNGEHLITKTRNNGALPNYIVLMNPTITLALVDKTLEFERIAASEQELRLQLQEKVSILENEIEQLSNTLDNA